MKEIRQFTTGQLFGIKARDSSVRTGVKVATLGRYDFNQQGFVVNMISSEGVAGSNQALRFEDRAAAERWIDQNHARFGYDRDEMAIMKTVGTSHFQKVPVAGYNIPGWVNVRKFNFFSAAQIERLKRDNPAYFDIDSDLQPMGYRDGTSIEDHGESTPRNTYRGFRF